MPKQSRVSTWLAGTPTSNRFKELENKNTEEESNDQNNSEKKEPKSPPIFIAGVQNMNPLITELQGAIEDRYELKILNNDEVKIQTKDAEAYRAVVDLLVKKNKNFTPTN